MRTVSLFEALSGVLEHQKKFAEVRTRPKTFFVHVKLPQNAIGELRALQRRVLPDPANRTDIDHITMVYTKEPSGPHGQDRVDNAVSALRTIGASTAPIDAKIQGWAYFDRVRKDGKPATALVALVDAPGLAHLHVDMHRQLGEHGIVPSDQHGFTPHITFGYLDRHDRADSPLPPFNTSFTIDKIHVAAKDNHVVPLLGNEARKAAEEAMPHKELERGRADETKEHHLPPELTEKIVRDHLSKDPGYYDKQESKKASLGARAAKTAFRTISPLYRR